MEPKNKKWLTGRINTPIISKKTEANNAFSTPNRPANRGIKTDPNAKHNSGMVVMSPMTAGERFKSAIIAGVTGPTETIGARRLDAKSTTPTNVTVLRRYDLLKLWWLNGGKLKKIYANERNINGVVSGFSCEFPLYKRTYAAQKSTAI